jgi:Domain of unknown function (DUF5916)/Carbohydrate family 9 binding domain-like
MLRLTRRTLGASVLLAAAMAVAPPVGAQDHQHEAAAAAPQIDPSTERPVMKAMKIEKAPKIDGLLDEPVWESVPATDQFTQQEPRGGEPATERTEVRVAYDNKHLFIAVHAYDSDPSGLIATEMRRDSDRLMDEDNFQILLDTFHDLRNGYMFLTTPLGAKLEEQISDEGEGGGRGTNSNINRNWDGVWDAAARITEDGWTAEISIPATTLRFIPKDDQIWGLNFQRNIRRKNEQVFWAPIPKAYSLTRISLAGQLTGINSLSQGADMRIKPFVVAGARNQHLSPTASDISPVRDVGFDARYGLTPGVNLDATVNTDFAQVEADEQQVNLTRFNLLFPEKRDFFLENAGLFQMGTGTSFTSTPVETDLFFTRRIGLSDEGQPIPILAGARVAGKSGKHNVGFLDIQTDQYFTRPGENFLVGRYSRDVLSRSRVGAIVVNKESVGGSPRFNRTFGADANLAVGKNLQISSFLAKTSSPNVVGQDMSFYSRIAYRDPAWNVWLNYLDVEENFNAEVGFVQRTGVKTTKTYISRTPRPGKYHIRVMDPMFVLTYVTDQTNRMIGRTQHFMTSATFDDGSFANVIYQKNLDVLDAPFRIQPGVVIPIGTYTFDEWNFTFNTNPAKRLYERFTYSPSEFYNGTRDTINTTIGVRATSSLSAEFQYQRNDVDMPYGAFLANLGILRVDYAPSARASVRTLTQYNSQTHDFSSSVRFNWVYRPGSDLYVVYNGLQRTGLPQDAFQPFDRQIVVKMTYLLSRN